MQKVTEEQHKKSLSVTQPGILMQLMQVITKHPLFTSFTMNSVMVMIRQCFMFITLRKYQILYREEEETALVFIPVYGELTVWSKKNGQFGRIKIGNTAGEEAICDKNFLCRMDNCYAEADSCLVCISRDKWLDLKQEKRADPVLMKEMNALEEVFRKHHFVKKRWRAGIINSNRSASVIQGQGSAALLAAKHADEVKRASQ